MTRKRLHPPKTPKDFCGADLGSGKQCKRKPANPGSTKGNSRCAQHGGKSTGPKTPEGLARTTQNAVDASMTHGLYADPKNWEEYRRRKYGPLEQKLLDEVPTAPDLSPEIQSMRLKLEMLERNRIKGLEAAERWGANPEQGPKAFGLSFNAITGELMFNGMSISRWIELENQCKDTLRKMMQSQKEINPAGRAKGNLTLTIEIEGSAEQAAQEDDVPELTDGDEADTGVPGQATVDAEVVEQKTGYENVED